MQRKTAPGHPGIPPTWTSSAKDLVGCALGESRIWFTLGFGIVNEVYYPRVDMPQIRDLGFIVADGEGFWTEVKRLETYSLQLLGAGSPAEVIHQHDRFRLRLRIVPDPSRDVLILDVELEGEERLHPYVLLAPRLGATGKDNIATITESGGRCLLGAIQGAYALALAAADRDGHDALIDASAGYVGVSDGWQDFHRNGRLSWRYSDAGPGNVAMSAGLPRRAMMALGFGRNVEAAATLARSTLAESFDEILARQLKRWNRWHEGREMKSLLPLGEAGKLKAQFHTSLTVLKTHRDKTQPGAMVASLSIPWGNSRDDRGGYHLVWPRDLVQCATALLAVGAVEEARQTLSYLMATQQADGRWHQNQWLDGEPYWQGVQLDEVAAPVLLASALAERDVLEGIAVADMVRRALSFIAQTGPSTPQDRWEENCGLNPYTLAQCIAALVAGAQFLPAPAREFALMLADFWNANLENWLVVKGTALSDRLGIAGYCIRVAPLAVLEHRDALKSLLDIKNQVAPKEVPADEEVSTDFLQLVRLGLRKADDPWMMDSVSAADALLKVETPNGPSWHRYNGDGYGEHDDGRPFDGCGRGRLWPVLTGERGHYELAAGRDPLPYLEAMASMTGPGGMIPEQVWDSDAIPKFRLRPGCPTGSAMPLAWAHAEFLKLLVSRRLGHPVDRPKSLWTRYMGVRPRLDFAIWCPHAPIGSISSDQGLVIAVERKARIHWGQNGWQKISDIETQDTGLGLHAASLDAKAIGGAASIDFTIQWQEDARWIGRDFHLAVNAQSSASGI